VNVHELRLVLRLPFAPSVLEVADQLLLLRIDGDERNAALEAVHRLFVDVLELRVSIWVLFAFHGLARCLETVAALAQQSRDGLVADTDPVVREHLGRQRVGALVRPAQRRFWIATRCRSDECFKGRNQIWMYDFVTTTTAAFAPNLHDILGSSTAANFCASERHCANRQPGCTRNACDAAPAHRIGLGTGPQPARSLVHGRHQ
jgi:hypothetical protein